MGLYCALIILALALFAVLVTSYQTHQLNQDHRRLYVPQLNRFKRGVPRRDHCVFAFNKTKIPKQLNTVFTDPRTPCIKWKCYRSGRIGLLRYKSGCPFEGRCIIWNPWHPEVEKTGIPCDERVCRIHWARGVLQYGMISPIKKAHCHYDGTCYAYGDVVHFPENCTTAVCDVIPRYRRWMRRPLWKPTDAGCVIGDKCYENGTALTFGVCLQHTCKASVKISQGMKNKVFEFRFHAVAELDPIIEGCVKHTGGCVNVNASYQASECVYLKCVQSNSKFTLQVDKEGCLHDSGCIDVGAGYGERCNTHTCEKKRDGNSITYYFVTRRANGCPNHFDPRDTKCYKQGEIITSTDAYGRTQGCPGAVEWKCSQVTKTVEPKCKE
ncbi:uncharacterized protein LOC124133845 [Haliotis rufescens]|uniref:uncharacterized protein LOC124133845 n=1 Tax=Haliotis rufescens TaxID=6454 RepID=UPI00201F0FFB|nr:uncharacterized protein LOC124133845 [Haliotis rufescens]